MIILGIDPYKGWAIAEHGRPKYDKIIAVGRVKVWRSQELAADLSLEIDEARFEKPTSKKSLNEKGRARRLEEECCKPWRKLQQGRCDLLLLLGHGLKNVVRIAPIRGGTKLLSGKIEGLTGWTGRTNEHTRDAIMIA